MSRWKILPAIIRGRQIGLRVLAGLRNVLQLQRSRSDFRCGGGVGCVVEWMGGDPLRWSRRYLGDYCFLNMRFWRIFFENTASYHQPLSFYLFIFFFFNTSRLRLPIRVTRLGIRVRRFPTHVPHCAALVTFYLRSRRRRSLSGVLSGGLTSFFLQDKGSWSGSYCTMIHPTPYHPRGNGGHETIKTALPDK